MAEKLCQKFGPGPHTLKIGKSFEKKGGNSVYHSIRYDFKPKAIDEERMGVLEVKEKQSVTVQLPHNDGVGQTHYKGNAETAPTKDCVLIIDHETGELTLERISNKIMVKKTRQERQEKPGGPPANPYEVKPDPPNPYEVKPNPYEVKPNPYEVKSNPYEVKPNPYEVRSDPGSRPRPPDRQRTSNSSARPNTPQQPQVQVKKRSPGYPVLTESLSPLHSNKSSPASTSGRVTSSQGYNVDSLGRPLSSSSDSSSSDSDSNSDVDDPKPPKAPKAPPAPAAPPQVSNPAPSVFSMPGDISDLLGDVVAPPRPGGTLPTARPTTKAPPARPSNSTTKQRSSTSTRSDPPSSSYQPHPTPAPPAPPAPPANARPPPAASTGVVSMPGMPDIFGDLDDDLELSDDSE